MDLMSLTAVELGKKIQAKEVTVEEAVKAAIASIKAKEENDFKITAQELEAAITPKTKWLILNSPSNPTGSIYSKNELLDIANTLKKHDQVYIKCTRSDGKNFVRNGCKPGCKNDPEIPLDKQIPDIVE